MAFYSILVARPSSFHADVGTLKRFTFSSEKYNLRLLKASQETVPPRKATEKWIEGNFLHQEREAETPGQRKGRQRLPAPPPPSPGAVSPCGRGVSSAQTEGKKPRRENQAGRGQTPGGGSRRPPAVAGPPEQPTRAGTRRAGGPRSHPRHADPRPRGQLQRRGLTAGGAGPAALPGQPPRPARPPRLQTEPTPAYFHARAGNPTRLRTEPGGPPADTPLPSPPVGGPAPLRPPAVTTRPGRSRTLGRPLPRRGGGEVREGGGGRGRRSPPRRAAMFPAPPAGPRARAAPGRGFRGGGGEGTLTLDGALAGGVGRQQQHLAPLLGGHRWALPGSAGGCWARRRLRPPPPPAGWRGEGGAAAGGEAGRGRLEAAGGGGGPAEHGGRRGSQLLAQRRDSPPRARHAPRRHPTRGLRERGETPGSAAPPARGR